MSAGNACAVVGYASLDHKYRTAPFEGAGRTTLIRTPLGDGRPDLGAASYFAKAVRRQGLTVGIVSWVGADAMGSRFHDELVVGGIDVTGLSRRGTRSPSTQMFYDESGDSVVWFDPGDLDQTLTEAQAGVVEAANSVLIGIGPAEATSAVLDVIRPNAVVFWAVKGDPASLPPALARRIAERADVICHSETETAFLEQTCCLHLTELSRRGTVVVTTHGSGGVRLLVDGELVVGAVPERLDVADTTGAGDTFAASLLARLVTAGTSPGGLTQRAGLNTIADAVKGACSDAHALLLTRLTRGQHA